MKRNVCLFFILFLPWGIVFSQNQPVFLGDTVKIAEVVVTRSVPLNDETMIDYYRNSHASSMDDINARLGGVSLISRGEYAMEPMLNSFSAGQINVTIDGMKMFGACTGKMDPVTSYVEPANLKSIELSHGSNGDKNGSTIGGTLNMILQKPVKSKVSFETGSNYETAAEGKTAFVLFNYGRDTWAYRLSGVYKNFSPYTDGNGMVVPFSQFKKSNLQQSMVYSPVKGQNLTFDWIIDNASDVGYPALPMDVSNARGRIYSVGYSPESKFLNINGFNAKLYANTVYHQMDDSHRDSLYFIHDLNTGASDSVYMRMKMPGRSNTFGGYVEGRISWSERNLLSFKVEDYLNRSQAEMNMRMNNPENPGEPPMHTETWPFNQRHVTGLYLKNNFQAGTRTVLGLDVRIDHSRSETLSRQGIQEFTALNYNIGKIYRKFVTSANLNLDLTVKKYLKLKTGIGYGERLPTLSEQFGFYLFNALDGYDYIGNPDIRTEKAVHVSGILNYTAKRFKFSWENYFNRVFDYIYGTYKPGYEAITLNASGVKQYVNLPFAIIYATNMQAMWKPLPIFEFLDVIKYNYGEMNNGQPLPLIQPLTNLLSVTWRKPEYYIQAEAEYSAAQNRVNRDFGEIPSSAFMILNFRSGLQLKVRDSVLKISAGIENVFNKAYSEHLDWGNYYRPGRSVYLGLNIRI